jgi:SNF2 family DNA or RNA helicase
MKPWTPRHYQLHAAERMVTNNAAGLLLAPGLGKTSTTLAALAALKASGQMKAALVITPLRPLYDVWPAEREKWSDFALLRMQILHGPKKERALATEADVYLINPEGLPWLLQARRGRLPFDVLVVDESTKFKNPASDRFKRLRGVLDKFRRRYILTGTPHPNGVQDLWAQVFLLDGGQRLGAYITHFRRRYMIDTAPPHASYQQWLPVVGAEEEIRKKIEDICLVLRAEDYLDMPELITNDIRVQLPPAARTTYDDLHRHFIAELAGGVVTAANAAAKTTKLRQVANGFVYDDRGATEEVHTRKLEALVELIDEQQGDPLLVAVAFLSEAERLGRLLGAPYIGGGVPAARVTELIKLWNDGKIPVLLAHPSSVAHGLNLQAGGRAVCWYGLTYNREEYDQFVARVYRQGQTRGVVVHRIIATDTIDEAIVQSLASKDASQRAFLAALRRIL